MHRIHFFTPQYNTVQSIKFGFLKGSNDLFFFSIKGIGKI